MAAAGGSWKSGGFVPSRASLQRRWSALTGGSEAAAVSALRQLASGRAQTQVYSESSLLAIERSGFATVERRAAPYSIGAGEVYARVAPRARSAEALNAWRDLVRRG